MIETQTLQVGSLELPVHSLNTVVVGSGAAGLNCACHIMREFEECGTNNAQAQVAVVTRGVGLGTSHNSGSDKQTYYKMGTGGEEGDTPSDFAATLTAAGCAHADLALIEGTNSLRAFYHLVEAGVPFPHNGRGGFVGYKTDHDPRQRGTSAGPWTSRYMVRKLLAQLRRYGVPVFDRHHALAIIKDAEGARGLLCVNMDAEDSANHGFVLFNCRNLVMAGGGPGDLYEISVYPKGQMGPYAALLEAGAHAENLTELQFGIASLDPRWNLSGTYQQVVPRYYSTDADGGSVREFLNPWFDEMSTLATRIFLKGYQWPFDHDKVAGRGSSLIDILVQNETVNLGRRVFMDFTRNPVASDGLDEFRLECLGEEALDYLRRSNAMHPTPIERLAHMNQPSIDLYRVMGLDLAAEPLEIGVCAQHCNGGFAVDEWWESTVPHLFVVGELAGTHGVKRPGGSALNAGQVGGLRAAQRIAHVYYRHLGDARELAAMAAETVERFAKLASTVVSADENAFCAAGVCGAVRKRMSRHAGMVRSLDGLEKALQQAHVQWGQMSERGLRQDGPGWLEAAEARELMLAQRAFLETMKALLQRGGGSRGSYLVTRHDGRLPHPDLGDDWRFVSENVDLRDEILTIAYDTETDEITVEVIEPRSANHRECWFENTWNEFRRADVYRKGASDDARPYQGQG